MTNFITMDPSLASPEEHFKKAEDYFNKGDQNHYKMACHFWHLSAAQGHIEALFMLCLVYLKGLGLSPELTESFNWLIKAAHLKQVCWHYCYPCLIELSGLTEKKKGGQGFFMADEGG
ncbi:MAG: hypothetical protein LBE80_03110 [Deltaproteobacteria bacterium]|jgi:TPR repeat protein|nr:hypothetical protein [Deltaproteobacteria bacterium]